MKINWKVRFKNPYFWLCIVSAIFLPILTYFGITVKDLTSWKILVETIVSAVKNPYVLGTIVLSVFNAIYDPTTKGISDSERAMSYIAPGKTKDQDNA